MIATRTPRLDAEDQALFGACRLRAARLQPYLASAIFSLVPVSTPGQGTFSVDRWWRVYVDMEQARRWGVEATAAVLLHEAHHVLRDHHRRALRAGVDDATARLWNLAADAAINDDLVADDVPLPDPVLPSHLGCDAGGLEEGYYRTLIERAVGRDARCGSGAGGVRLEVEWDDEADDDVLRVDDVDAEAIRRGVAHEVTAARARGEDVPERLGLWAHDLLEPKVPWRSVLRSAVGRPVRGVTGRAHPSWRRPDRRADSHPDVLRPGTERIGAEIAVVIDTSASMCQLLLDAAVTELRAILRQSGSASVSVVVCDAEAVTPQRVRRLPDLELTGGGGTDLRPGIRAAAALRPRPSIIVVLTDGLTPWPASAPPGITLVVVRLGDDAPPPTGPGIVSLRVEVSR